MILIEGNAVKKSQLEKKQVKELININKNIEKATDSLDILKYDRKFH